MGLKYYLSTEDTIRALAKDARKAIKAGNPLRLQIIVEDRTQRQNSYFHAILTEVSKQAGDQTPKELKAYAKLHFGVPILRESDPGFRAWYDKKVKPLPYEQKLALMETGEVPVTSAMDFEQMASFLEQVARHFAQHGYTISQ